MTGYSWQLALDRQHALYWSERRALVIRTEPPKAGGRWTAKGPPDYIAVVRNRTLVLDAKCYRDGFRLSDLPDHQAAAFDFAEKMGHTAGLVFPGMLAWWRDFGEAWLRWRNQGGEDGVVTGVGFVGTDWLSVVEDHHVRT